MSRLPSCFKFWPVSAAYWFFDKPNLRRFLAVTPAVPVLWVGLMWGYLVLVPKYFLVDAGYRPDIATWEEACRVPNADLVDVNTPIDLSLEKTRTAFIALTPDSNFAVLRMPGCQVEQFSIRWSNASPRVHSVAATGAALYSVHDKVADQWSWWVVSGPGRGSARDLSAALYRPNASDPIVRWRTCSLARKGSDGRQKYAAGADRFGPPNK